MIEAVGRGVMEKEMRALVWVALFSCAVGVGGGLWIGIMFRPSCSVIYEAAGIDKAMSPIQIARSCRCSCGSTVTLTEPTTAIPSWSTK